MAHHQQVAHERLYLWVQRKCPDVDSEMPDTNTSVLLRRALQVLRARPAFYKHCQDIVTNTRRAMLVRRFMHALTRGGPNGTPRPIEVHAHDPQRYVGDMLAWMHQAVATERELVTAYFGEVPGAPAAGGDDGESKGVVAEGDETTDAAPRSSTEVIRDVLTNVFEGVATPLKMRVLQALGSGLSLLACFKLGDLISFYAETVGVLLRSETGLAKAITQCREAAREQFSKQLASQGAKLVNSPPVRCACCPQ